SDLAAAWSITARPFFSLTPDARSAVVAATVVSRSSPIRTTGTGCGGVGSVAKGLFKRRLRRKAISLACFTLAEPLPCKSRGNPTTISTMAYSEIIASSLSMSALSGSFGPLSRGHVSTGIAKPASLSAAATPMRTVPTSKPRRRPEPGSSTPGEAGETFALGLLAFVIACRRSHEQLQSPVPHRQDYCQRLEPYPACRHRGHRRIRQRA